MDAIEILWKDWSGFQPKLCLLLGLKVPLRITLTVLPAHSQIGACR